MKSFLVLAAVVMAVTSCKRNLETFEARGTIAGNHNGLPEKILPLVIDQDMTLTSDTCWVLDGKCYVKDAILTIEEGTLVTGIRKSTTDSSSALIITRSGQIDAQGSSSNPIVFTSHEATPQIGDWGGVVLLGSAPINKPDTSIEGINLPSVPAGVDIKYGGGAAGSGDVNDNSGTLRFVRIEYAGARIADANELNGLTCGGVGKGTRLEFIEVALGNDDAFEFFGGTVDAKYLIAYSQNDDGIDTDFGFTGRLQFVLSARRTSEVFADANGMESDNDGQSSGATPQTKAQISNMTILGFATSTDVPTGTLNAARLRRNTNFNINNSVFAGYNNGIAFDGTCAFVGNVWHSTIHGFNTATTSCAPAVPTNTLHVGGAANANLDLIDPFDLSAPIGIPDYRPNGGSPLLTANGATVGFEGLDNADGFFDTSVNFRGAFAATGFNSVWDQGGWAKYDY